MPGRNSRGPISTRAGNVGEAANPTWAGYFGRNIDRGTVRESGHGVHTKHAGVFCDPSHQCVIEGTNDDALSVNVTALTDGVLNAMFMSKLKIAVAALFVATAV